MPQIESLKTENKFKKTEIGEIPVDWEMVDIGDICDVVGGSTPATNQKEYWGGDIFWAVPTDITNLEGNIINETERTITKEGLESCAANLLPKGSILMTSRATIGECAINTNLMATNQGFASLICSDKAYNWFIFYKIISLREKLKQLGGGSTFMEISKRSIRGIKISLPPLPEQKKIAEILSSVDEAIEKVKNVIEKTQRLKKALMQQLLTGNIRFKGFEDKNWITKKLKEVARFENGKAHEGCISDQGKYIVVNSKFISSNGSVVKYSDQNLSPLLKGDITMVMSDVPNGQALAKCYLINENNKFTLNQRICSIRADKINNEFLYYKLNRNKYYLNFDDGVSQTNLKKNEVLNCFIDYPESAEEQFEIVQMLNLMELEIDLMKTKLELLKKKKTGLMQVLLMGKVRVKI